MFENKLLQNKMNEDVRKKNHNMKIDTININI